MVGPRSSLSLALGVFLCTAARGAIADPAVAHLAAAAATPAAVSVNLDVVVLHGTNDGRGIDPRLGDVPVLRKPPFSEHNSYRLLDRSRAVVTTGRSTVTRLPSGSALVLALLKWAAAGKGGGPRYALAVSLQRPGGAPQFVMESAIKPGETIYFAPQPYLAGLLVVGLTPQP